jgi:diphthamide synthase (EF-2-diphthine--ammonia ligase)
VVALITTVTGEFDRVSIHGVRRAVLQAQVRALGLPLIEATILAAASNTAYETLLADLPPTVDPCGERGEFHTCVYAGPLFAKPLALHTGSRVRRDGRFVLRSQSGGSRAHKGG